MVWIDHTGTDNSRVKIGEKDHAIIKGDIDDQLNLMSNIYLFSFIKNQYKNGAISARNHQISSCFFSDKHHAILKQKRVRYI
jgi:hypothetical protein